MRFELSCNARLVVLLLIAAAAAVSIPNGYAFQYSATPTISPAFPSARVHQTHSWNYATEKGRVRFASILYQQKSDDIVEALDTDNGRKGENYPSYSLFVLAGVVGYRALLGASALAIALFALSDSSFFDGTGLDTTTGALFQTSPEDALPWLAGGALLACPFPQTGTAFRAGLALLGALTMASPLVVGSGYVWSLAMLSLMVVSVRELWYFGGAYKQECGITLFMLPLMLDRDNLIPFAAPLCAVGMAVLAGGKVLEPLEEDLVRSNSEFLAK